MAASKERGVSRIQEKLSTSISAGKYYEAHQLYKTLYFRYLSQNKFVELIDLLENGARLLLEKEQMESGSDLAIQLIDVLVKSKLEITDEWVCKVTNLFSLMNPSMPERETFVVNASKWAMGDKNSGNPLFHTKIAKIYWEQKNTLSARQHFLRSSDGVAFGTMLIEMQTQRGLKSEVDMFIVQAALQTLSMRRNQLAVDTFNTYTANHPEINTTKVPYPGVALNFVHFVFRTIELGNAEKYKELVSVYEKHLVARDPIYSEFLDKIGNIYFGIPLKPKRQANGLMGSFLNSLMTNMDVDDSSSDEEYSNARTHQAQPSDLE